MFVSYNVYSRYKQKRRAFASPPTLKLLHVYPMQWLKDTCFGYKVRSCYRTCLKAIGNLNL